MRVLKIVISKTRIWALNLIVSLQLKCVILPRQNNLCLDGTRKNGMKGKCNYRTNKSKLNTMRNRPAK